LEKGVLFPVLGNVVLGSFRKGFQSDQDFTGNHRNVIIIRWLFGISLFVEFLIEVMLALDLPFFGLLDPNLLNLVEQDHLESLLELLALDCLLLLPLSFIGGN
jgi:ABC-type enterochelin transport system permease subunit